MKKQSSTPLHYFLCLAFGFVLLSCSREVDNILPEEGNKEVITPEEPESPAPEPEEPEPVCEEINRFTLGDLKEMKSGLEEEGVDMEDIELEAEEGSSTRSTIMENEMVRVIKIAGKTAHPDRSGKSIIVSGVLLMPTKTAPEKPYRMVVVPPCTYTDNENAPSIILKRLASVGIKKSSINLIYYWAIRAKSNYVVFIPDYPGFGDSHGKCTHPYMDAHALTQSTLDLMEVAQTKLLEYGYPFNQELIVAGYSQGAFVATSLVREIETNPIHKHKIGLLITGGTPHNLGYIISNLVSAKKTGDTYLLPYLLWGYKENGYPELNISAFLQEPYASTSKEYFDGTHSGLNDYFSKKTAEVYTDGMRNHKKDTIPEVAHLFRLLDENSIKPWPNLCKFVTTHGTKDVTVHYKNTKTYVKEHKAAGGKVSFYPTKGTHGWAQIYYYSRVAKNLKVFK